MNPAAHDPHSAVRRKRLGLAGAVTVAATAWAALQPDAPLPAPVLRDSTSASSSARVSRPDLAPGKAAASAPAWPEPTHRRGDWPTAPAKAVAAWSAVAAAPAAAVPRPAAAASAADKPVEAPAFPYTLIGRLDDGEARALLAGPMRSFGVKASDVIDGQWRVDAVQPRGLALTWLPGGVKKTLALAPS